jgi:hypothetical protein
MLDQVVEHKEEVGVTAHEGADHIFVDRSFKLLIVFIYLTEDSGYCT